MNIDIDININNILKISIMQGKTCKPSWIHRICLFRDVSMIRGWSGALKKRVKDTQPLFVFQLWQWAKRGKLWKMRSLPRLPNSHLKRYALFSQLSQSFWFHSKDISNEFETKLISFCVELLHPNRKEAWSVHREWRKWGSAIMRRTMSRTRIKTEKCPWMARNPNELSDKTCSETQSHQSPFPSPCRWLNWNIWSGITVICVKVKVCLNCDAIVPMHFIHTVAPAILMYIMTTIHFSTVHFQSF